MHLLSLGVTSPHIILFQLENELCSLRFSACTYPQQGNFHDEHCKGAWLARHVSVVLTPTYITPVKKKKKCSVCVASLCHCRCLFHQSLCFVLPLCIYIYTSTF